jgi:hypothetical protein
MIAFLPPMLIAIRALLAGQLPRVQRIFNFAVGNTYTFVIAYLSDFDIPWIYAKMCIIEMYDWVVYALWRLQYYYSTFQEHFFNRLF